MKIPGNYRKLITGTIFLLIMALFISGCSNTTKLPEDAVALINGKAISIGEFEKNLALQKMSYETQLGPDIFDQEVSSGMTLLDSIKRSVLESLVIEEILFQEANKKGIEVTQEEIQESIDPYMEFLETNEALKEFTEKNEIDEDFIKSQMTKDITIHKYRESFIEDQEIAEEAAKAYYDDNPEAFTKEEVEAKHILVIKDTENAEKKAQDILDNIKNPEDFETHWKKYAEGAEEGIIAEDLGAFGRGAMVPEFEQAAFSLKPNEISAIVETSFGYHIILVEDTINETLAYEDMKDNLIEFLKDQAFQDHVEELIDKAKVVKKEEL